MTDAAELDFEGRLEMGNVPSDGEEDLWVPLQAAFDLSSPKLAYPVDRPLDSTEEPIITSVERVLGNRGIQASGFLSLGGWAKRSRRSPAISVSEESSIMGKLAPLVEQVVETKRDQEGPGDLHLEVSRHGALWIKFFYTCTLDESLFKASNHVESLGGDLVGRKGMEGRESKAHAAREQAFARLRDCLEQVEGLAQNDAEFATRAAALLEAKLGNLRVLTVAAPSLSGEELGTGAASHEPLMSAEETIERLRGLRDREAIQAFLDRFVVGRTWGGFEQNYLVATGVTEHLKGLNLRLRCKNDDNPSYLRCKKTTGNEAGSFYFEHYTNGQQWTHGGYSVCPPLEVVPAPPRRGRKTADKQEIGLTHPTS